ncbi:hypothetical protein HPT27_06690 [Permianibacter sp. IMCC34836]|uniref:hypothetical protein n=1 Tax=Permianibacter fluminis TaxID=2738515 RepID=UPI001556EE51|nr:hypothetical protein [Permianibacter fluminis]NQD36707.1 hypothetical protein [Permianibacter fluminis]
MRSVTMLFLLLSASSFVPVGADLNPQRIADLNQRIADLNGGNPEGMQRVGDKIFFSADDGVHGRELWVYNESIHAGSLVRDIKLGSGSGISYTHDMALVDDKVFFYADDGVHGLELWVTDGTSTGSHLLLDRIPGLGSGGFVSVKAVKADDAAFLIRVAGDSSSSYLLYRSDGTEGGTYLATSLDDERQFAAETGALIAGLQFHFFDDGSGPALWWREANGNYVKAPNDLPVTQWQLQSTPKILVDGASAYLFLGNDLWYFRLDGVAAAINLTDGRCSAYSSSSPLLHQGKIYFVCQSQQNGVELWRSDGTSNGTQLHVDMIAGSGSGFDDAETLISLPQALVIEGETRSGGYGFSAIDWSSGAVTTLIEASSQGGVMLLNETPVSGELYFAKCDDISQQGFAIWKSNGTFVGTKALAEATSQNLLYGPQPFFGDEDSVFFTARYGEFALTYLFALKNGSDSAKYVAQIEPNHDYRNYPIRHDEKWYFSGRPASGSYGLWEADKFSLNSKSVIAFSDVVSDPSADGNPRSAVIVDNQLAFIADKDQLGAVLWLSDGSATGTRQVTSVPAMGESWFDYSALTAWHNQLFMMRQSGPLAGDLWRIDPVTAEASQIYNDSNKAEHCSQPFVGVTDAGLLLCTYTPAIGAELWLADGTASGTHLLRDLAEGAASSEPGQSYYQLGPTYWQGRTVFPAKSSNSNSQVWLSDGSESGTMPLSALIPEASSLSVFSMQTAGEQLVVAGTGAKGSGWYFFRNGGQQAFVSGGPSSPSHMLGSRLFFHVSDNDNTSVRASVNGAGFTELGKFQNASMSAESALVSLAGHVAFTPYGQDGHRELWVSDGSSSGTRKIPLPDNLEPKDWLNARQVASDALYLIAGNESRQEYVLRIARSPTSENGFSVERATLPFQQGSSVLGITAGTVFISAEADEAGHELWSVPLVPGTIPSLSKPGDVQVLKGAWSEPQSIVLADGDTTPETLVIRIESSIPTVVSAQDVELIGSGAMRQLRVRGSGKGSAQLALFVTDGVHETRVVFTATVATNNDSSGGGDGGGSMPVASVVMVLLILLRKPFGKKNGNVPVDTVRH